MLVAVLVIWKNRHYTHCMLNRCAHVVIVILSALMGISSVLRAELEPKELELMRTQIFLDQNLVGPGVIDGRSGWVTNQAIEIWKRHHPEHAEDEAFKAAVKKSVPEVTAFATVPEVVLDFLNPKLPKKRELQAKEKQMSYLSISEFMAERYHTTPQTLIRLNSRKAINALKVHDGIVVPAVKPFLIEDVKHVAFKKEEALSTRQADIDTEIKRVTIYDYIEDPDEPEILVYTLIASFPITPGKEEFIRRGEWQMKNCVTWPNWRYDKQLLETGKRSKEALIIPPGPNNPVGVLWAGLTRSGIGLHGTSSPETIGRSRSAGCIRLANWDIIRIPSLIRPPAAVVIR